MTARTPPGTSSDTSARPVAAGSAPPPAPTPPTRPLRGLLLLCLTGVVWGTIGPAVDVVNERSGLSAFTIGAYRSAAALLVLVVLTVLTGRSRRCLDAVRGHARPVLVVGVSTAVFLLLFFLAVLGAGVSVGTVVSLGSAPVLLLAATAVRHRRLPGAGRVLTVLAAVAGLVLVGAAGTTGADAPRPVLGVLAAVGAGAAYVISAETAAPLTRRFDTLTFTTVTMIVIAAVLVPGGLLVAYLRGETLATPDAVSWGLVAHLGIIAMAVAYATLFAGLRDAPGGAAVLATLLEPVTAVLIAVAFLGERLTLAGVAGSLLILAAIGSLGRRRR